MGVQALMTGMRQEMRAVLTDSQRQKAHQLMLEQHSKMRIRMARRLALELEMPIEQELLQKVSAMDDDYDWPMDKKQLDEDRKKFKQVLKSVLTDEQQQVLAERRKEARERWQSARERGFPDEGDFAADKPRHGEGRPPMPRDDRPDMR